MNLNIIGNVFSGDGYASHIVQLARALKEEGVNVSIETPLPKGWQSNTRDDLRKMIENDYSSETNVLIGLPNTWKLKLSDRPKKFFGFFVWESKQVPKYFVNIMNDERISGVLVPSDFVKQACIQSGVNTKLFVIPHGVNLDLFKPEPIPHDKFTFLFHKGWVNGTKDRSGLDVLLKAFSEEFTKTDATQLFIKLNPNYLPEGWDINEEIKKLEINFDDCPEICITMDYVNINDLPQIYNKCDVCVIPSKGEGFGLTYIEAMACKLPCIATNYGGHTDFINDDNGWLISYDEVQAEGNFMLEECKWAQPRINELRLALRDAYENSLDIKKRLSFETAKKFTWKNSAKKLIETISEF